MSQEVVYDRMRWNRRHRSDKRVLYYLAKLTAYLGTEASTGVHYTLMAADKEL